jgi:hypothetical protein
MATRKPGFEIAFERVLFAAQWMSKRPTRKTFGPPADSQLEMLTNSRFG